MTGTLLVAALVCLAVAAVKVRAVRRNPGNPGLRSLTLALSALSIALFVFAPPVYFRLDAVLGVPNVAQLIGHSFVLISAWQARALLMYLTATSSEASRNLRRRRVALAGTVGLLTTLFLLAPVDVEAPGTFTQRYATAPFVTEYWLTFLTYLAFALGDITRLCWRYARLSERTFLRLGLRLIGAGSLLGIAYFSHWGLFLLLERLDGSLPAPVEAAWRLLFVGAVSLLVVGSTIPAWGRWLSSVQLRRWASQFGAYRQLCPLWRDLQRAGPGITSTPSRSRLADPYAIRDVRLRLYRRVIEIRDGRLALRPYLRPDVQDAAARLGREAGLGGEDLDAVVEAACLAVALEAKRQQEPPLPRDQQMYAAPGGHDIASDTAWLQKVASAYTSSPVVRRVVSDYHARGSNLSPAVG